MVCGEFVDTKTRAFCEGSPTVRAKDDHCPSTPSPEDCISSFHHCAPYYSQYWLGATTTGDGITSVESESILATTCLIYTIEASYAHRRYVSLFLIIDPHLSDTWGNLKTIKKKTKKNENCRCIDATKYGRGFHKTL